MLDKIKFLVVQLLCEYYNVILSTNNNTLRLVFHIVLREITVQAGCEVAPCEQAWDKNT